MVAEITELRKHTIGSRLLKKYQPVLHLLDISEIRGAPT
jgi:hypothetical protein